MATDPNTLDAQEKTTEAKPYSQRVLELQDQLLLSQEKNLMLTAQIRELERGARDTDDLKGELTAQGLLLADKSKENKHVHQELSRVTGLLDVKLNEAEELRTLVADLQQQLKMRESERDLLAVMLNEAENAQRRQTEEMMATMNAMQEQAKNAGWLGSFNKKK
jgi:hypothetical protein